MGFDTDQHKQIARLPSTSVYKSREEGSPPLSRLEKYSPAELRARVNITGVDYGDDGQVVNWSPENDYTPAQMAAITDALQAGRKWIKVAARAVP